ncbi:hypothetical protein HG530_007741 [Fusarium avenaceum]|nr:hypothetical protein HG530_007741 [Fusarium avenaceum]
MVGGVMTYKNGWNNTVLNELELEEVSNDGLLGLHSRLFLRGLNLLGLLRLDLRSWGGRSAPDSGAGGAEKRGAGVSSGRGEKPGTSSSLTEGSVDSTLDSGSEAAGVRTTEESGVSSLEPTPCTIALGFGSSAFSLLALDSGFSVVSALVESADAASVDLVFEGDKAYPQYADVVVRYLAGQVATAEHVTNELLNAWLGDELTSKLVGTDTLLLVLRGIGRNGDNGFDEVTSGGLDDPVVFGAETGKEAWDDIFRKQPLENNGSVWVYQNWMWDAHTSTTPWPPSLRSRAMILSNRSMTIGHSTCLSHKSVAIALFLLLFVIVISQVGGAGGCARSREGEQAVLGLCLLVGGLVGRLDSLELGSDYIFEEAIEYIVAAKVFDEF